MHCESVLRMAPIDTKPTTHGRDRRQPFDSLPLPQQAGILSNDPRFRAYVGAQITTNGAPVSASAAAAYLRSICGITSRKHLPYNADAQVKFAMLRTEFDAWRGKISRHR